MKERLITIVLTILIICLAIAAMPSPDNYYNIPKMIIMLAGGLILLILLLVNYKKLTIDKKDMLILIFAGFIFISTMLSSNIKYSLFGAPKRYEGMLAIFTYIMIYLCSKKFLSFKNKKMLLNIFYIIYIAVCILGVLQYYIKIPELYPIFSKGVCGTFGNTNFMGSFVSIGIAIFTLLYIIKGSKLNFFASNLVFFCMIACHARSSWVAFIGLCFIILIYLIKQRNKEYLKRTFILIISFTLIFTYLFTSKDNLVKNKIKVISKEIKTATEQGIQPSMGSSRISIWAMTLGLIKEQPIIGVGTDNLAQGFIDNPNDELIKFVEKYHSLPDKAHNEYLHIAATIGIPALIIYLTFIFMNLFKHRKQLFSNSNTFIISSAIICYLVQAFFNISTIGVAPIFWFLLGIINNKNCKIIEE